MDADKFQALEAMVRALKALKQAKKRGIDVKPYKRRMKEARGLFRSEDYPGVVARMEEIILEVTGLPQPPG